MQLCYLFHCSWMYFFQHAFDVIFAVKNKRTPHLADLGNLIDFLMGLISLVYVLTVYKGYRANTFLEKSQLNEAQFGERYWQNYLNCPVNENAVLLCYGVLMWAKFFYSMKFVRLAGSLFAVIEVMILQMWVFCVYYSSILFLFGVVGFVLFYDIAQFAQLRTALYTLFRATVQDYDVDIMQNARVGAFIGYVFFIAFLLLNLILIVNLIVARLARTFKDYYYRKDLLFLLNTLYVREVSEADDKYSAIVSGPFPLNMLNITLGALVISMRSVNANIALLAIYYLPVSIICFIAFMLY